MEKKYFFSPSKEVIDAFNRALSKNTINPDFQILLNKDRKFGQPDSRYYVYPMATAVENIKQKIMEPSTNIRTDMMFSGHPNANIGIDPFRGIVPFIIKPLQPISNCISDLANVTQSVKNYNEKDYIVYEFMSNLDGIGRVIKGHLDDLDSFLPDPPEPRKMGDLLTRKLMGILDKNTFKKKSHKRTY